MRGLEGAAGGGGELAEDGLRVDGVTQAGAESRDGRLGVVARAVEAAVDERAAAGCAAE